MDLLFVIDNSGSMAEEQVNLRTSFSALLDELGRINNRDALLQRLTNIVPRRLMK